MTTRAVRLDDAVARLEPGMTVFVPGMSGESLAFLDALKAAPHKAAGVRFVGVHFPGINQSNYLALHPEATQRAYFMQPHLRPAFASGRAELMPLDYPGTLNDLAHLPIDIAVAQVSPRDEDGLMSLGPCYDFLPAVWQRARIKVAHVNHRISRTRGSFQVRAADCDLVVEADAPLVTLDSGEPTPDLVELGRHVASVVRDGDTLQMGIGNMVTAVLRALVCHRNLHVYSGMITGAAVPLIDGGVIAGEGAIEVGVALGDEDFYRRVGEDPTFYFRPVAETHDVHRIAAIPGFVSINAALEIDLLGQVNCDSLDGRLVAGVGGMPAFVQGAQLSKGGRAIFCLPATADRGDLSRIVSKLGARSLVASPRHALDTVVTEYGAASLRGRSVDARAERLIQLAAPQFRERLLVEWREIRATI
jgi:acyl-CoA hydrolase